MLWIQFLRVRQCVVEDFMSDIEDVLNAVSELKTCKECGADFIPNKPYYVVCEDCWEEHKKSKRRPIYLDYELEYVDIRDEQWMNGDFYK